MSYRGAAQYLSSNKSVRGSLRFRWLKGSRRNESISQDPATTVTEDHSRIGVLGNNNDIAESSKLSTYVPGIDGETADNDHIGDKQHKFRFWRHKIDEKGYERFHSSRLKSADNSSFKTTRPFNRKHHFRRWLNRRTDEIAAVDHIEKTRGRIGQVAIEAASAANIRCNSRATIRSGAAITAAYGRITLEKSNPEREHTTMITTINEACEEVAKNSHENEFTNADYLKLRSLLNYHLNSANNEQDESEKSLKTSRQEANYVHNQENYSENHRLLLKLDDNNKQNHSSLYSKESILGKKISLDDTKTELVASDDSNSNRNNSKEPLDKLYDPFKSEIVKYEDFEGLKFNLFSSAESALGTDDEDSRGKDETEASLLESAYPFGHFEDEIWPQVASMRRHRLLLQMESLAPKSLLLENLTKDC